MSSENKVGAGFYYDFLYKHAGIALCIPFIIAIAIFLRIYTKFFKRYRKRTKLFSAK